VGLYKERFGERVLLDGRIEPVLLHRVYIGLGERDFFGAARVPFEAGRTLSTEDIGGVAVVVNATLAALCWPGEQAIGRRFQGADRVLYEVVGVVGDFRSYRRDETPRPMFFRPIQENRVGYGGGATFFVVRLEPDTAAVLGAMRTVLKEVNPGMQQPEIFSYSQRLYDATAPQRTYRNYLAALAGTGLMLAAIGIYGVLAYSVERRTREIGIRMAIGADARAVMRMIVAEGSRLVAVGAILGLLASFWLTRLIRGQLFAVEPNDPATMTVAAAVLVGIALLACWLPARRAAKVDPMTALRAE
jgi:ABC-type antimicrobial peptide transport system permease subunit